VRYALARLQKGQVGVLYIVIDLSVTLTSFYRGPNAALLSIL
jgi:hypothetical protein